MWFVLSSILNDSLKALLAAWLLHRALRGPVRLKTYREFMIFIGVAAAAVPLISAIGALPARRALGDPLWSAAYRWFLGDALAQVIVTPTLLYWCTGAYRRVNARLMELGLLSGALVVVLYFAFVARHAYPAPVLLYTPVPFLVWAAVRLRPFGAASAVSLVSLVAVLGAINGTGVFSGGSSNQVVLSIQLFLLMVGVSTLSLAMLVAERESKTRELEALLAAAPITILIATDLECKSIRANHTGHRSHQVPGVVIPPEESSLQRAAATGVPVIGDAFTWVLDDGTERHMLGNAAPLMGEDGKPCGAIGAFMDITERKLAEEQLRELSGRLIDAQEQERARIARELHDDFAQRMVLLQFSLDRFRQGTAGLSSDDRLQLNAIVEATAQFSTEIRQLSHRLHPSTLEIFGAVEMLRGLCQEVSAQHRMRVRFVHHDVPAHLPKDVNACLFRVTQEALRNVVTHSGAAEAAVELSGYDERIELCIADAGTGFDPQSVREKPGIGLVSMRERLRSIRGRLVVRSAPARGTRICVSVPVSRRHEHADEHHRWQLDYHSKIT